MTPTTYNERITYVRTDGFDETMRFAFLFDLITAIGVVCEKHGVHRASSAGTFNLVGLGGSDDPKSGLHPCPECGAEMERTSRPFTSTSQKLHFRCPDGCGEFRYTDR